MTKAKDLTQDDKTPYDELYGYDGDTILVIYTWRGYDVTVMVKSEADVAGAKRKIKKSIVDQYEWAEIYDDSFNVYGYTVGVVDVYGYTVGVVEWN